MGAFFVPEFAHNYPAGGVSYQKGGSVFTVRLTVPSPSLGNRAGVRVVQNFDGVGALSYFQCNRSYRFETAIKLSGLALLVKLPAPRGGSERLSAHRSVLEKVLLRLAASIFKQDAVREHFDPGMAAVLLIVALSGCFCSSDLFAQCRAFMRSLDMEIECCQCCQNLQPPRPRGT